MIRLKNIRPGFVLIPGHRLRLPPGGIASVEAMSPELGRAIAAGLVVRVDPNPETRSGPLVAAESSEKASTSQSDPAPVEASEASVASTHSPESLEDSSGEDLSKLSQAEAIQKIAAERDPKRLRALVAIDKRPRVQDAIRRRLTELESVAPR